MIWVMVFSVCMPDALRGPDCHEMQIARWTGFATCEVNRPFVRRMLRDSLDATGLGAAEIDAGRCVPSQPTPPGELM